MKGGHSNSKWQGCAHPPPPHWLLVFGNAQRFHRVLFRHFWYIDGWVSVPDPMRPIRKSAFWKLTKKGPNLFQIGCFLQPLVSNGSQNQTVRGIEMVKNQKSTLTIPIQNLLKTPGGDCTSAIFKVEVKCTLGNIWGSFSIHLEQTWGHLVRNFLGGGHWGNELKIEMKNPYTFKEAHTLV